MCDILYFMVKYAHGFPNNSLIDEESAQAWVLNHFHPQGLCCRKYVEAARHFRKTETSGLQVYR